MTSSFKVSKRHKRLLFSLVISSLLLVFGYTISEEGVLEKIPGPAPPGTYRVVSAEDGDTITVDMNGTIERVRFIGIDTPETQDPRKPVQCFGKAASAFTKELLGNNPVRLELDPLSSNRDRYNRLLRYIYLPDGRLVQAEILRNGYGFAYTSFPFTKSDEFLALQKEARENNRGLWNTCDPEENQYGGFDSNPE